LAIYLQAEADLDRSICDIEFYMEEEQCWGIENVELCT